MFTGLVEDLGEVVSIVPEGEGRRVRIRTRIDLSEVGLGDSIACDGACLTAVRCEGSIFEVVAGRETLERTTLGSWKPGRAVHLERALRVGDRLGGHLVQGHVDGLGRVVSLDAAGESWILWVDVGEELAPLVAPKGSLTVDGISLTVNEVRGSHARINLIPHTVEVTRVSGLKVGDRVNLEVDVLARYVARLLTYGGDSSPMTLQHLQARGVL